MEGGDAYDMGDGSIFVASTATLVYENGDSIYAEFDSQPYTVEALCAVDLNGVSASSGADGEYTVYVGESLEIDCGREFDSTYNLYSWEITEGASLAELSGEINQACRITAKKEGTVKVRVTYEYGIKEPDVLTDIPRTVGRSKILEYIVNIKKK